MRRTRITRLATLIVAMMTVVPATAQTADDAKTKRHTVSVYGRVYDSFTRAALPARVELLTPDSVVVDTATAKLVNYSGVGTSVYNFRNVPGETADYILRFISRGYEVQCTPFRLHYYRRKTDYEIKNVLLKRLPQDDVYKEIGLDEVVVKATKVKIAYRCDTVVYNASAFNLPEGSMLDALIRQLPGAELRGNGDIYVNGEKIDYLMLNGKEFFKGKNKVVLDNLPYFVVDNVQVYHHASELDRWSGRHDHPKDFVMDLKLRREYNRGAIVNAEAGVGTRSRYLARLFGLLYDDLYRVSAYAKANNVNETRAPGAEGDRKPERNNKGQKNNHTN